MMSINSTNKKTMMSTNDIPAERVVDKKSLSTKPFTITPVNHFNVLFCPVKEDDVSDLPTKQNRGRYLSFSFDGTLNIWNDSFELSKSVILNQVELQKCTFVKQENRVYDMLYIKELDQLAVSTNDSKVLFYDSKALLNDRSDTCEVPQICYSLKIKEIATAMNYWSGDGKAVFSFVDITGYLFVFVSHKIREKRLFCKITDDEKSSRNFNVKVSELFKTPSEDYPCFKIPFNFNCRNFQYFPALDSFAICGTAATQMLLFMLPRDDSNRILKKNFRNKQEKEYFRCTEYSPTAQKLVTGGTDGCLRVWALDNTNNCEKVLKGHSTAVTHIRFNPNDKIFISLSIDANVRLWSEDGWSCMHSYQTCGMETAPVNSVCYNIHNNELVLAYSDKSTQLVKGTCVFKDMMMSHSKPICAALYHSINNQVVSLCQDGVAKVWDVMTGNAVTQFNVTPEKHTSIVCACFDKPQRRLITATDDGKVRLWNFNDGTELDVLPVTVHRKVTSIVCTNERMFVSGIYSNRIFDLDLKKNNHKYLEHDYLKDIISMDLYDNLLCSVSSDKNVVVWLADTGKALISFNASKSARAEIIHSKARTGTLRNNNNVKKTAHLEDIKSYPNKGLFVMFLKTRKMNEDTATLLTSASDIIYAWSVCDKGGMLGKFRAVKGKGSVVTTMSTDDNEHILMTGDSTGGFNIWDISKFGFKKPEDTDLSQPPLLGCWHAHVGRVVSVKCDANFVNFVTAGSDCNVFLWAKTGKCKGHFGRNKWDPIQNKIHSQKQAHQLLEEKEKTTEQKATAQPVPSEPPPTSPTQSATANNVTKNESSLYEANTKENADLSANSKRQISAKVEPTFSETQVTPPPQVAIPKLETRKKWKRTQHQTELQTHQTISNDITQRSEGNSNYLCFPPISDKVNLTGHQTNLKPHPAVIPPIGATGSKNYSACMEQTLDDTGQRSEHRSNRVLLRPISDKAKLTGHQTNLKPHPAVIPPIRATGSKNSSTSMEQSLDDTRQRSRQRSNRVLLQPISDKAKLTGHQTNLEPLSAVNPPIRATGAKNYSACMEQTLDDVGQKSDGNSNCLCFPPISDKVNLTGHQTNLKPHPAVIPPIGATGSKNVACMKQTPDDIGQTSEHRSNRVRLRPISDEDNLRGHQKHLKPHPAVIPPIRATGSKNYSACMEQTLDDTGQRSRPRSNRVLLRPISDKAKLTGHQTNLEPLPAVNPPIRATGSKNYLACMKHTPDDVSQKSDGNSNCLRFPPISDKVNLTGHQTNLKPHPAVIPPIGTTESKQTAKQNHF